MINYFLFKNLSLKIAWQKPSLLLQLPNWYAGEEIPTATSWPRNDALMRCRSGALRFWHQGRCGHLPGALQIVGFLTLTRFRRVIIRNADLQSFICCRSGALCSWHPSGKGSPRRGCYAQHRHSEPKAKNLFESRRSIVTAFLRMMQK